MSLSTTAPSSGGGGGDAYGPLSPEQAVREFDSLRREATKLERHLEDAVAKYQQLAQRLAVGDSNGGPSHEDSRSSLLDSTADEEAKLSQDIHRTMSAMTDLIHTKMAPVADRTGRSQHALLVKRYREILFDCGADFKKTCAAVARRREAVELFRGAQRSPEEGPDPAMEQLLRERNAIDNSLKSASSVLSQAAGVRTELRSQGASLRGVTGTMATIAANIPGVNTLIDKIRKKRRQDDMVVSGVVAACILFTIWYLFG